MILQRFFLEGPRTAHNEASLNLEDTNHLYFPLSTAVDKIHMLKKKYI